MHIPVIPGNAIGYRFIGLCLIYALSPAIQAQTHLDPTRPAPIATQVLTGEGGKDGGGQPRVSAVFINDSNKHAIVNGQLLSEGQNWHGFEVLEINPSGVVLVSQEGQLTILIDKNLHIKKDAENGF